MKKKRWILWVVSATVVVGLGGGVAWWRLRSKPVPPAEGGTEAAKDTGMDRQEQEEMMKAIGYVQ